MKNKIKCMECGKEMRMITNTHLKYHGLTKQQYMDKWAVDSLACEELREVYRKRSKKSNETRKGVTRSQTERNNIRTGIRKSFDLGREAHNKGISMSEDQKEKLRIQAKKRNSQWQEDGNHPLLGHRVSSETKATISKSVLLYAEQHPDKMIERGQKTVSTKQINGYFQNKRNKTIERKTKIIKENGFDILSIIDPIITLRCQTCDTVHSRSIESIIHSNMCGTCSGHGISKNEIEISNYIKSLGIIDIKVNDFTIIPPLELDIVIPSLKIAIEHDGIYWHSEIAGGKSRYYHSMKTKLAKNAGYRLIHIFEDEWNYKKEIVKNRIRSILGKSKTIMARKCSLQEVSKHDSNKFMDENHIQGRYNSVHNIGLYLDSELIAVMSFNPPNITKGKSNYDFELTRYASIGNVVGGASKLFSYFIKTYNPSSIISYCDLRWGEGKVYEIIGFSKIGITQPNYWYTSGDKKEHRYKYAKHKLIEQGYDTSLSEWEIMKSIGRDRIWDCGHAKYVWKPNI